MLFRQGTLGDGDSDREMFVGTSRAAKGLQHLQSTAQKSLHQGPPPPTSSHTRPTCWSRSLHTSDIGAMSLLIPYATNQSCRVC
jgi:hypothetical protein